MTPRAIQPRAQGNALVDLDLLLGPEWSLEVVPPVTPRGTYLATLSYRSKEVRFKSMYEGVGTTPTTALQEALLAIERLGGVHAQAPEVER